MKGPQVRFVALLLPFLLGSCAAYRLGPPESSLDGTIYIAPVSNQTQTPQVRALLTEQLRRVFLTGPEWTLSDQETAQFQLEVVVVNFAQETAATREEDTARGLSFEMRLAASYTLRTPDGAAIISDPIEVSGISFDTPGTPESNYQALPAMTAKLAEQIRASVTERW